MNQDTPIVFSDGTAFYAELSNIYKKHSKGYFILAPSGSGKTHYVNNQGTKEWIDGDYLWPSTSADLSSDEWEYNENNVHEINRKSDVITHQAKKLGFWIIGSSNESLRPDAIVLLPWKVHVKYITNRQNIHNDGGALNIDLKAVKRHRNIIRKWAKVGVPICTSIEEAVQYLAVL